MLTFCYMLGMNSSSLHEGPVFVWPIHPCTTTSPLQTSSLLTLRDLTSTTRHNMTQEGQRPKMTDEVTYSVQLWSTGTVTRLPYLTSWERERVGLECQDLKYRPKLKLCIKCANPVGFPLASMMEECLQLVFCLYEVWSIIFYYLHPDEDSVRWKPVSGF